MTDSSPTIRRRYLAAELSKARKAAGITAAQAAEQLGCAQSKISRMEAGVSPASVADVRMLLDFYGVPVLQADRLLTVCREARLRGWWHDYRDLVSDPQVTYVGLEDAASAVRTFETTYIPGLLQTQEYARAVIKSGSPPPNEEQVERLVGLRMNRQAILRRNPPTRLWAVIDEAAIRRVVGSDEIMYSQLLHLAEAAAIPHVDIQILPFSAGAYSAMSGAFTILQYPEEGYDDSAYLRTLAGDIYVEELYDLDRFSRIFSDLTAAALSQRETISFAEKASVKG